MPRLAIADPATHPSFQGAAKAPPINIFRGMAACPDVLRGFLGFGGAVKQSGALSEQEIETVALTTAQFNECDYCLAAHTKIGQGAGLSGDEVLNIRRGSPSDPKLKALTAFTRRVLETKGYIADSDLAAVRSAGFSDAAVVAAIGEMALMTFTALFNHVNHTDIDVPAAPSL